MKNDEVISLRKELEFYSSLIAEHERVNGKSNFNSHCTPTNVQNAHSYKKPSRSNILSSSKKFCNFLQQDTQPSCSFASNHFVKKQPVLDNTLTTPMFSFSKRTNSKFSMNCSSNKKLPYYSAKNQYLNSKNLKISSDYTWHNSHMCHGKNSEFHGIQPSDGNSLIEKVTTKSCPEKLIGEILTVTQQLKMKSESLSKIKNEKNSLSVEKSINEKRNEILPCIKKNIVISKLSPKVGREERLEKDVKHAKTNEVTEAPLSCLKYDEKGTKDQSTYSNMLNDIKAIEKKLSQAKKTDKLKIGKYRHKTSTLSKTSITRINNNSFAIRKKVASNHYFNKYSLHKSLTFKKNPPSSNQSSILRNLNNVSKYTFLSLPNMANLSPKSTNQLTSKYKIVKNVQTSLNKTHSSPKVITPKNVRKYKLYNSVRKKHIFKLVNENNITKRNFHARKIPTSTESFVETPLSAKFVSMYNKAATASPLNTDVDVDLLLELASENVPQKRIYHTKNAIINSHSVKSRVAKMIKSKYFAKKFSARKNYRLASKCFRGHFRNSSSRLHHYDKNILKKIKYTSKSYALNKYQSRSLIGQKRNIVNLGGEKFLVGSSGKTLKKISKSNPYYFRKSPAKMVSPRRTSLKMAGFKKNFSPVSKTLASRALNRSIDTVLSASTKKKLRKVNIYCIFYNRFGRCNRGLKCSYVHDPSKIAVCTRFLRGTCKNEKCLFLHEINPGKMAICSFFLRGSCTKNDCPYRHEQLTPDATLCKDFVQGYCSNGKECLKAHVLLCRKHVQGVCKKGNNCSFIHTLTQENNTKVNIGANSAKSEDLTLDTVNRYFDCNSKGVSSVKEKNLVIPRLKCLPEQPSFISLKMDEIL